MRGDAALGGDALSLSRSLSWCVAVCCSVLHVCMCGDASLSSDALYLSRTLSGNAGHSMSNAEDTVVTHMCCSVLQCVAVCCSALQCVAVCRSVLQCVAVCCSAIQRTL